MLSYLPLQTFPEMKKSIFILFMATFQCSYHLHPVPGVLERHGQARSYAGEERAVIPVEGRIRNPSRDLPHLWLKDPEARRGLGGSIMLDLIGSCSATQAWSGPGF